MIKLALVQEFGLGGNGGGPKILRSLVHDQPFECVSICCQTYRPPPVEIANVRQRWIPLRRQTRLDNTRLSGWVKRIDPWFAAGLQRRIIAALEEENPDVVHVLPHSAYDWQAAAKYCETANKPLLLSMHDDLRYTLKDQYPSIVPAMRRVWNQADHVFCICPEMGDEYGRRFGKREFEVLTDGVDIQEPPQRVFPPGRLHVYFCGLLHHGYVPNFVNLLKAMRELASTTSTDVKLIIRGGQPFQEMLPYADQMEVRPFANDITADFDEADLLYLPLPFGEMYADFVNYSLSTKLVSYLASGIPALYHGPSDSALANLLASKDAAHLLCERQVDTNQLQAITNSAPETTVRKALALARRDFCLTALRARLLSQVCREPSAVV